MSLKTQGIPVPDGWYEVHKGRTRKGDKLVDLNSHELRQVGVSAGSTVASMKRNRFAVIRRSARQKI